MSIPVVLAIVIPLAGLCAAWGALMWRVGRIEKDLAKLETLGGLVAAIDSKIETARTDQGRRLGKVEARQDKLDGFQAGYAATRRKTRASDAIPDDENKEG